MTKPHIAFFIPSLSEGGAERVFSILVKRFHEEGHPATLILNKKTGKYLSQIPEEVDIYELGANRLIKAFPELRRLVIQKNPDILLSTITGPNILSILTKLSINSSTRVIIRVANTPSSKISYRSRPSHLLLHILIKMLYRFADDVIAVSEGVSHDLQKNYGINVKNITVIHNPRDINHVQSKADIGDLDLPDQPIILGVGRLVPQKDFPTLIRSFNIIQENIESVLIILGEGPEQDKLEKLIADLNLTDSVQLRGFVDNPYPYYKNSNIFILTSRCEGCPNTLIESLACGTPVVATDCPSGPREILQGGKYGSLAEIGDAEQIAELVKETLRFPPESEFLKERAGDFDIQKNFRRYQDLMTNN